MNILVIGSGGREHAIIKKLKENPAAGVIYALPGNAGMAEAVCVPLDPLDPSEVTAFCRDMAIGFCIVTPEDPLAKGLVDVLETEGITCLGPTRAAAAIESSKLFAKRLMQKYRIPTAAWQTFSGKEDALSFLDSCALPIVIKADGLLKGKGVIVADTRGEARSAVRSMVGPFIIEECLVGHEVSVLTLVDGENVVPLLSATDHKRALDEDKGPNTGGMGAVAPSPFYTLEIKHRCMRDIYLPTARAMVKEGIPFRGCLFFGLILTKDGPKVLEYNARFGDPETQAVLALMDSDLLSALQAVTDGTLAADSVSFRAGHACCVVAASGGYPGAFEKGLPIHIEEPIEATVHMAGVANNGEQLVTAGGRVLSVTATGDTLEAARKAAYREMAKVHFDNMHYRRDIGAQALMIGKE